MTGLKLWQWRFREAWRALRLRPVSIHFIDNADFTVRYINPK